MRIIIILSFFVPNECFEDNLVLNFDNNCSVVSCLIENKLDISLLVDSGASLSVIKYEWLRKYPDIINNIVRSKITIKGISGNLDSVGYIDLNLYFNGVLFTQKFYVFTNISCTSNGILGQDFLSKYQAVISYENCSLTLTDSNQSVVTSSLLSWYLHTIPPRCEVIKHVPIHLDSDCVVLGGEIPSHTGIFIASIIAKPQNGKIAIKVLNTTDEEKVLDFSFLDVQSLHNFEMCSFDDSSVSVNRVKQLFDLLDLSSYLNKEEQISIENICAKYADVFHIPGDKLSVTNVMEHSIKLRDNVTPVYKKPYRLPHALKSEVQRQIKDMLDNDIIEESTSEWSSPVLLVPKKCDKFGNKQWRLVVDYRQLNNIIQDDKFPLPNITEILDSLSGSVYFSKLDLSQSYYQLSLSNDSRKYTAFTTDKTYQMKRCPMGLKTSPNAFSRLMTIVMSGLNYKKAFIYLDDCIIIGNSIENHNKNLIAVLERFRKVNLKLNPTKCEFLQKEIMYLGHKITSEGIIPDPSKIQVLQKYPTPLNTDDVKRFVAFTNYYRRFIPRFASIAHPLNQLCKKNVTFQWSPECESAFQTLKTALTTPPILQYPDFSENNTFVLQTDASKIGLGAVLSNSTGGVVAYASRSLNQAETRYPIIELELLAIVWAVRHFRPYLYGKRFKIVTDHKPLIYLFSMTDPSSRLTKFRLHLEEYDFVIEHVPGKQNAPADALSRLPITCTELKELKQNIVSVLTRSQRQKLNTDSTNSESCNQNSSNDRSDQPKVIEILKKPINGIELILCSKFMNYSYIESVDVIKSKSGNCIYVPSKCCMYLFTRSSSTYAVLMREIEALCRKIGINELTLIKNKDNKYDVNMLLREIRSLESPRILVIKDVIRITNDDDKILILNDFHLLPTSGHAGINRMTNNIKKYYYWKGLDNDVKSYVSKCKHCQMNKFTNKYVKEPMVITSTANSSFEIISLDLIGPLEIDSFNYKYALTLQCNLTKFVEAYPLERKDTETVAQTLVENFILRYGVPKSILTDQGTEFLSSVFTEICKLLNIKKLHSTAYHHETIGALENTHKNLGAFLRIQCSTNRQDWSSWLPYWCFAFNTSVHTETKYTPYELVFGKLCNLPSNLQNVPTEPLYNYDSYPMQLKYRLQKAQSDAKTNILTSKEKRKLCYDKNIKTMIYKPGDYVLLKNQTGNKLDNIYLGPFLVIEDLSPNVKILKNNREYVTHKNNTKLFKS